MKKIVLLVFVFLLFSTAVFVGFVGPAVAEGPIYIRADGSVEGTDKIHRDGNVYTFTGNIDVYNPYVHIGAGVGVQRDNIVIDGAGYSIQTRGYVYRGIDLTGRSNVTIKNMKIRGFNHGIYLDGSSGNTISGNDITGPISGGYPAGFWVWNSSNNNISGNKITAHNEYGILFQLSNNNTISGNTLTNNRVGIRLSHSSNNVLRNNQMNGNNENFGIGYSSLSEFIQDIDTSNTVEGKPIYYWINEHDKTVPSDAGFVALGNCTNITVQNLKITNNNDGMLLYFTTDSVIANNNVENNGNGISVRSSQNINVTGNKVTGNRYSGITVGGSNKVFITENYIAKSGFVIHGVGISLSGSTRVLVSGNNITANNAAGVELISSNENDVSNNYIANNQYAGINLIDCHENRIIGNTLIENNGWGIRLSGAENNTFYHNNLINNKVAEGLQVSNPWFWGRPEPNAWDNGVEGNYWSDYELRYPNATEIDGSGIGDTPFFINEVNIDRYPLMRPFVIPEFPDDEKPTIPTTEPFPTMIVAAIAIIAVVGVALLVYFAKVKKTTGKAE